MNSHKHARLTYIRRIELVRALTVDGLSTSEVATLFAVTPATVRKWLGRYLAGGDAALADALSRTRSSPRVIEPAKALLIVELRQGQSTGCRFARARSPQSSSRQPPWLPLAGLPLLTLRRRAALLAA